MLSRTTMVAPSAADALDVALCRVGYACVDGDAMREMAALAGNDWGAFAESWNDMPLDEHMADGRRCRRRRFSTFAVGDDGIRAKPPQPHFQTREHNRLNGGVDRFFEPMLAASRVNPAFVALVELCRDVFTRATPPGRRPRSWHVEAHQFRIEAAATGEGRPTPEGMHRDGVDWALILLVARHNVAGGVTTIADRDHRPIERFTMTCPLEACFIDDHRVYHGVSPIRPLDPAQPAWRDALVLTFRG